MSRQALQSSLPVQTAEADVDERRRASWLLSRYSDSVWVVADSHNATKTATLDFRSVLADGRLLVEAERLCATVKEYAWWLRDARYSRIDDAYAHAMLVQNMIHLAHALSLRNIWSFSHLQPFDLELLIEDCRYGTDAVLHASQRLELHLQSMEVENKIRPRPFGGLPHYIFPSSGSRKNYIDVTKVLSDCNIPSSVKGMPRIARLFAQAAEANGFPLRRAGVLPGNLDPLPNLTAQALQRWLVPLEQLYAMRRRIDAEAIGFRPFPKGAARVAAVKGVGVSRTPIPPPRLVLHLLEQSANWIFTRSDSVVCDAPDRESVVRMATACWIIIAAFTARRSEEIGDLEYGCLRGDVQSGWWLHVYIEKTLQRKEWIPVPALVVRAIETMTAISSRARRLTSNSFLFQWCQPTGQVSRLNVGAHLDDFAALVGVPLQHKGGTEPVAWHWSPHQFRRFFAVLYFYRFEGATIEVLSHHLRHFNLEMTRRYISQDPEVASLWTDVEWGYMGHIARSIAAGERSVSGAMGEHLKKAARRLVDVFRRKLQIATPERIGASLTLIMQRQGLVLTPKLWVTCTCPRTRDAAAKAGCRRDPRATTDGIGPDFAFAGPLACALCPHAVTDRKHLAFIDQEVLHLEAVNDHAPRAGTLFGALERSQVVDLSQIRRSRYEGATPFEGAMSSRQESP